MLIRTSREIDKLKNKPVSCSQLDNVIRDGYLTASEEYKMLTRSGEVYQKWIEKVKKYQGKQNRSEIENMEIDFKEKLDIIDYKKRIDEKLEFMKSKIAENEAERESIIENMKDIANYKDKDEKGE